jgi:hypothetical protein
LGGRPSPGAAAVGHRQPQHPSRVWVRRACTPCARACAAHVRTSGWTRAAATSSRHPTWAQASAKCAPTRCGPAPARSRFPAGTICRGSSPLTARPVRKTSCAVLRACAKPHPRPAQLYPMRRRLGPPHSRAAAAPVGEGRQSKPPELVGVPSARCGSVQTAPSRRRSRRRSRRCGHPLARRVHTAACSTLASSDVGRPAESGSWDRAAAWVQQLPGVRAIFRSPWRQPSNASKTVPAVGCDGLRLAA